MAKAKAITRTEVAKRIKGFEPDVAKAMVCAMVGHSRIQTTCFGYFYCARCDALLGDTLASTYEGGITAVIVDHNCDKCRENAKTLTWRDTFMAPDPFKEVPTPLPQ